MVLNTNCVYSYKDGYCILCKHPEKNKLRRKVLCEGLGLEYCELRRTHQRPSAPAPMKVLSK